ncbi:MAG TPA: CAP domain-containing protein [Terriglobia bacterium]|nr:CAP domain-containing protein [Terriglobia bacterium]
MKANALCWAAVVFAGFQWAATVAGAGPQTFTEPDAATPSQTETQAAQKTPKKKSVQSGEWHHFGEHDSASGAGHRHPAEWRHFGPNHDAPQVVPAESGPRQTSGTNRMADLETQMWALVNQDRRDPENSAETAGRAQPLRWNEKLAAVARAHSRDMVEHRYFGHVDRKGRTLSVRINAAGIPWRALGENIAINGTVAAAEASFMNEPRLQKNHRANILNANFTDVGIGIARGPRGSLYITQDFAAIPPSRGSVSSAPRPTYQPKASSTPTAGRPR